MSMKNADNLDKVCNGSRRDQCLIYELLTPYFNPFLPTFDSDKGACKCHLPKNKWCFESVVIVKNREEL